MERIPSAQPPPLSKGDLADMHGMDFPMYAYKPRRGMKRGEESKETYKLPHRLIEKKRRDRINECIAQLKDLLPEHLKLTTLGHLEKAVVLELTLKHMKTLSTLLEQQQQKILALQSGMHIEQPLVSQEKSEEMFRSGFHMCAKEMLQYLASRESDGNFAPSHVINHLHKLATEVLQSPKRPHSPLSPPPEEMPTYSQHQSHKETPASLPPKPSEGYGRVPVIQRAHAVPNGEQSGSDTDTDSGYGGELEKIECGAPQRHPEYYSQEGKLLKRSAAERQSSNVKREDDEPRHKRARAESSEDEMLSGGESSASSSSSGYGSYMSVSPNHPPPPPHPLCMPFYLIPPTAATYLPMLEKCWYPGAMPLLYPGVGGGATAVPSERPPQMVMSPRGGSPAPAMSQTPMDSPALLQALKQVPPLNLETKD
ncbi:class E basic helix-loop-helix protein 40-like isoform X1 [Hippocampus comes]|uniref:class E basic helix-loop-helix protein 40-like isoform X1 n=1 Tax=Hippocampus comes TaxID=109280 RepID=UPI00094EA57A|nr:PREDICTED: class E basic helix-loop-helix protein 40-like isoform X1 [Hippocampus comes]